MTVEVKSLGSEVVPACLELQRGGKGEEGEGEGKEGRGEEEGEGMERGDGEKEGREEKIKTEGVRWKEKGENERRNGKAECSNNEHTNLDQ